MGINQAVWRARRANPLALGTNFLYDVSSVTGTNLPTRINGNKEMPRCIPNT